MDDNNRELDVGVRLANLAKILINRPDFIKVFGLCISREIVMARIEQDGSRVYVSQVPDLRLLLKFIEGELRNLMTPE